MPKSKGKEFEGIVKAAAVQAGFATLRLYDTTNGFAGVNNPCDFVIYKRPYNYYIECKSTQTGTLNFAAIRENQWEKLGKLKNFDGAVCGFLIWFIKNQQVIFVPYDTAAKLRAKGHKSLSVKSLVEAGNEGLFCYEFKKSIKRVFFDFDLEDFENTLKQIAEDLWQ